MANRTCSVDGCNQRHEARGWCSAHYQRWKRYGTVGPKQAPEPNPGERWLPVPGYEGLYEVSDHGRIRSLDKVIEKTSKNGVKYRHHARGRMMHQVPAPFGHLYTRLHKDGQGRTFFVHRLVLMAFVGPRPEGTECCHNDGVATNNRLENLRWDTAKSNAADRTKHGVQAGLNKTHCPRSHILAEPNLNQARLRGKRPQRACLACARAAARLKARRKNGEEVPMDAWADWYYVQIMGSPAPAPPEPFLKKGARPEVIARRRRRPDGTWEPSRKTAVDPAA